MSQIPSGQDQPGRPVPPPKRTYQDESREQTVDAAERVYLAGALMVGGGVGATFGMFLAGFIGFLVGLTVGAGIGLLLLRTVLGGASKMLTGPINPSGKSTAYKHQYSDAESCGMRGDYSGAIEAYQRHVVEEPMDSEPYVRIARIYRDHLGENENAISWFKRARIDSAIDRGRELLITQEIIELYLQKLRQPRKAIPELARLCERFPDTPAAKSAQSELDTLRKMLDHEREGGAPLTEEFYKNRRDRRD